LDWLVDGLGEAETVTAATQDYRHDENAVGQFIEDECTVSDTLSVPKANLYDRYAAWAEAAAERPMSHRAFTQALRDLGFDDYRTGRTRFYRGLALIDAEDGDR
jgi:putative DNA primase/helicase